MFDLFTKALLLSFLPHVQEIKCEIRRSAAHLAKTRHFNVSKSYCRKSEAFNVAKTELSKVAKTNYLNVITKDGF